MLERKKSNTTAIRITILNESLNKQYFTTIKIKQMKQLESVWDAKLYDEKHSFVYDYGKSLVELLNPKDDELILDLGCGTGQLTANLAERAKEATGIDLSPEMIENAMVNYPSVDFQIQDAANFHFDKKFDSIFSNATLHWVTNYKSAIRCMFANLKKGGKIVLEFGGKGNVQSIVATLRKSLRNRGYKCQSELQLWYFPSIGEYSSELESVGFEVTFAQLYERPTELADEATGIKDWISMFCKPFFKDVLENDCEEIKSEVQQNLKPLLFQNGKWYADYKRIRVIAFK